MSDSTDSMTDTRQLTIFQLTIHRILRLNQCPAVYLPILQLNGDDMPFSLIQ